MLHVELPTFFCNSYHRRIDFNTSTYSSLLIGALISLNITDYYANVSTLSGNTGDYLTTVGIVYNDTIIDNLGATFSTQGSYRSRINIDSDGKVTLAETCQLVA